MVLIAVLGGVLALYLWPQSMSTHSAWFWFCILVLPSSVGLVCYSFRLRTYENERDRVNYWNRLHQQQYELQLEKGQRPAGVLGKAFITPIACNKLASAMLSHGSQLQSTYFPHLRHTLTTARLEPSADQISKEGYRIRLTEYLMRLHRMLKSDLSALADDRPSVRIRHDGSLDNVQIEQVWRDTFPAACIIDECVAGAEGDGMMWLDAWLDRDEATLMLSVEINLFLEPRDGQSESISALLLASPAWLTQHDIKPEALIYRPVIATQDISSLQDMLRWGALSADENHTLWRSQVDRDALTQLIQQSEKLGYTPGQHESYILDDLFGEPGAAAGNIAMLCACEHAIFSDKPQWIMITDNTTHQAIVRQAGC